MIRSSGEAQYKQTFDRLNSMMQMTSDQSFLEMSDGSSTE